MKKDNCKDCVSKCEHAGKDREFVCIGGVSGKAKEDEDKVLVIRCKDCKHRYEPTRCALWYGECNGKQYFLERGDDFYCSYGERRENDRK